MGAKDLQKELKKKKNKDAESLTINSNLVQNEENFAKVTEEKNRKKKKLTLQNRRSKDEIGECHLSYNKGSGLGNLINNLFRSINCRDWHV